MLFGAVASVQRPHDVQAVAGQDDQPGLRSRTFPAEAAEDAQAAVLLGVGVAEFHRPAPQLVDTLAGWLGHALQSSSGSGDAELSLGLALPLPAWLTVPIEIMPGVFYPSYRLAIIVVSLLVAIFLYVVVMRTRLGMLIRAGASNREMIGALGINIKLLFTLVFGLGAALAGLAGLMQAPILTVQIGMGENILILAFVVIVIGGIGSIRGAFLAAILVGLIDTLGRAFLPNLLRQVLSSADASTAAPALSSMLIYLLMAIVLVVRPEGLFPASRR